MNLAQFKQVSEVEWQIAPFGKMRVPAVIFADQALIRDMDDKVFEQLTNVATLPGIVQAAYAMPDAHWGYGFPIGGVAAFDADAGGVVSAGGVGFDISCGVRTLHTGLRADEIAPLKQRLADRLFAHIPAGVGSTGPLRLNANEMDAMLRGGARWAVEHGYGSAADLDRIEEQGCMAGAEPDKVSDQAKRRQRDEIGTLGSGNHYLELQEIVEIFDTKAADRFRLRVGEVVVSIHCGSRGLGHQIGTEFLKQMVIAAPGYGIELPDRELACAPINVSAGSGVSRRHARGDQLCAGQPSGHHPSHPPGVCRPVAGDAPHPDLRRVAQHLQAGTAHGRWPDAPPVRAPQGRDARLRPWPSGAAR